MKALNRKALNVMTVGLALGVALAHRLTVSVVQADPTVQQTNWA
ncbi:MAG TPA: hypothetical protein V6D20_24425 [Candidatus Obscuribacterales bacterium]|nr:hypothetical protein [Leptolyngbya sp. CCY15150]